MIFKTVVIWAYVVASTGGQVIKNYQKNVMLTPPDERFQFEKSALRKEECQCSRPRKTHEGEWVASCRVCADANLASSLQMTVAIDTRAVASLEPSETKSCALVPFGSTQFTKISCRKTFDENLVYVTFWLEPADPKIMFDQMPWMCAAEAKVSNEHFEYFSTWSSGQICYKETLDAEAHIAVQRPNGTTLFIPTNASTGRPTNASNATNLRFLFSRFSLDGAADFKSSRRLQVENRDGVTYRLMKLSGSMVATAVLLIGLIGGVLRVIRRGGLCRNHSFRNEKNQQYFLHKESHESNGQSEYETINDHINDGHVYATPINEQRTQDRGSGDISINFASEEITANNTHIYQPLSQSQYSHLDDYQRISPNNACYAQLLS